MIQVCGVYNMEPTIPQNATVLINTDEKEPIEGKIYLLAKAGGGNASALLLRRLKRINGQWHMLPDNPNYPVKQLTPEWIIVGRAVESVYLCEYAFSKGLFNCTGSVMAWA